MEVWDVLRAVQMEHLSLTKHAIYLTRGEGVLWVVRTRPLLVESCCCSVSVV